MEKLVLIMMIMLLGLMTIDCIYRMVINIVDRKALQKSKKELMKSLDNLQDELTKELDKKFPLKEDEDVL